MILFWYLIILFFLIFLFISENDTKLFKGELSKDKSVTLSLSEKAFSSVCSIVGAVLAEEVINSITHRNTPLLNTFYYNTESDYGGIVIKIENN